MYNFGHVNVSKNIGRIFNLAVYFCDYQIAKFYSSLNFPTIRYVLSLYVSPSLFQDHVKDSSCTGAFSSTSDDTTLDQCLELFTEPETLTKDEAW